MVLRDLVRGDVISNRLASGALGQLARRLVLFAADSSPGTEENQTSLSSISENYPEKPVEHLRRAIASARGPSGAVPDPQVYSELRLLLNQIESGRVSPEPSRALIPPPRVLQKKPRRRLSVRGAFRFARRVAGLVP